MKTADDDGNSTSRDERIDRVVALALTRYRTEGDLDVASWQDDYPELMPELGEKFDTLIKLQQARELARRSTNAGDPAKASRNQNLESLRAALSNYEILEEIHYGGQGVVYEAVQLATKRVVALKVLLEGLRATERQRYRFEREAELIARLEHRNIVTLYESGVADGRLFYVMQYVDGRPIDDYVLVKDPTVREIVRLFVKICRAVAFAHQNGIIHRDLHPANIVIDPSGEPCLLDFGLAKDLYSEPDTRVSSPGQVVGALPYLSPEQVGAGDGRVDVRSDVYTLGVVLYVLLAERFPYGVTGGYGVVREKIIACEPTSLRTAFVEADPERRAKISDVNADLDAILRMALAKDKQHRYQSAAEFADDLENFLAGGIVKARAANRLYVWKKMIRRYRMPAGIVAGIIAILSVSTFMAARALQNARSATELAYDQFDAALKAVDSIKPLAGGVAVRNELLDDIADTLPRLSEHAAADPAFRALSSRLTERLGDIAADQGRRQDAAEHYRLFLNEALEQLNASPYDDESAARVLRTYRKLAECSDDALAVYGQGVALTEQFPVRRMGRRSLLELCDLQLNFGLYWMAREENEIALSHLTAAETLYENHSEEGPAEAWRRLGAKILNGVGMIKGMRGDADAGYEALERSRQIREELVRDKPADTASREELALIYFHLARIKRDKGEYDTAIRLYKCAADHREMLHQLDPTVITWGRQLFNSYVRLGGLYLKLKRMQEARDAFARATTLFQEASGAYSASEDMLDDYAYVLINRGKLLEYEQKCVQALTVFKEAYEIRRRLLESDPDNRRKIRNAAFALQWLGHSYNMLYDADRSAEYYQLACDQFDRLYHYDSGSAENILDLAAAQVSLAGAHMKAKKTLSKEIAQTALREARSLLSTMQSGEMIEGYEARFKACLDAVEANECLLLRHDAPAEPIAPCPLNHDTERREQ